MRFRLNRSTRSSFDAPSRRLLKDGRVPVSKYVLRRVWEVDCLVNNGMTSLPSYMNEVKDDNDNNHKNTI